MIRTIVKPTKSSLTIKLPENLIGKLVEVIAFEVYEPINKEAAIDMDKAKLSLVIASNTFSALAFNRIAAIFH